MVAFVRLSAQPICERGYVDRPDVLVAMDAGQLGQPEAAVLAGVDAGTLVLVNSSEPASVLAATREIPGRVVTVDVSAIVLAVVGRHVLSAAMAAAAARAMSLAPWTVLAAAIRRELADSEVSGVLLERNLAAAERAFEATPVVGCETAIRPEGSAASRPGGLFVVPRLPARFAAPAIVAAATSARRTTAGWRLERPIIHRERCTRCVLCFALCPEGAIALDAEHWPVVDYAHCKGCGVCVHECPTQAIEAVREEA